MSKEVKNGKEGRHNGSAVNDCPGRRRSGNLRKCTDVRENLGYAWNEPDNI